MGEVSNGDFFTRIATSSSPAATLYANTPGGGGPWLAFAVLQTDQPDTLALADAWGNYLGNPSKQDNGGLFIVGSAAPPDPSAYLQALVKAVAALNAGMGGWAYRYLFVGDPTSATPGACPGRLPFSTTSASGPGTVQRTTTIALNTVGIQIGQGVQIFFDPGVTGLRLHQLGAATIQLVANKYNPSNISTLTSDVTLPFEGALPGAFGFTMTLAYSSQPGNDDFTRLDAGIKYFAARGGRILSQRYPLFGPPIDGKPVPMQVHLDPLHPLDGSRSAFIFAGDGTACVPMESALRDGCLHPVRLVPQPGASRLVFQRDRVTFKASDQTQVDSFFLAPAGPFGLAAGVSTPPAAEMMGGFSPIETISFDPPGSVIRFFPDQPGFSPLLSDGADASDARLTSAYTTAWATVDAADPVKGAPLYYSQPQGAPLYAQGAGAGNAPIYLEHQAVPACALTDAMGDAAFPLVPYASLALGAHPDGFTSDDVRDLEIHAIAVERHARIQAHGGPASAGVVPGPSAAPLPPIPSRVTTPQGFLVDLGSDGSWKRVHLAQTVWSPDPAKVAPTTTTLALDTVDDTLRGAFQTNQQMLVVTNPKAPWTLAPTSDAPTGTQFEDSLAPQGWPFNIAVGTGSNPGDYRNVLIFKFCSGALEQRIADPTTWTAADQFNDDPGDLSAWLATYIDQAKQLAQGPDSAYFARFVQAVTDPAWQGILALRTDVDASALPQDLRGLTAGIDLSLFNAHHLGVDISFVQPDGSGSLSADGNSSVFATVYYVDPTYAAGLAQGAPPELPVPVPGTNPFAFRVLTLKALFDNAALTAFSSKLQITLNQLFSENVSLLTLDGVRAPSNSLVLDGTYENHDGVATYVFGTHADARFLLVSNLWRGVEITGASFAVEQAPVSGTVVSRFAFDGYLDFAMLQTADSGGTDDYDLLSFGGTGTSTDPAGTGLPFGNLHVDMQFDTASPNTPSFAFRIDQITFAPSVGNSRDGSFYGRMPVTLTGLINGTGGIADRGYLPVDLPNLPTMPLGDSWIGLTYTLDLGTAGALAAKAGFTANMLVAWGPRSQGSGVRVAVGLALPGASPTSRALSLQSVLKLTIDRILLYRDKTADTFVLRLSNLLLSLLGVKLPPGTSTAFILFGNPEPGQRDAIAWYAALNREKKPTPTPTPPPAPLLVKGEQG